MTTCTKGVSAFGNVAFCWIVIGRAGEGWSGRLCWWYAKDRLYSSVQLTRLWALVSARRL
jgi:hypothetical protein